MPTQESETPTKEDVERAERVIDNQTNAMKKIDVQVTEIDIPQNWPVYREAQFDCPVAFEMDGVTPGRHRENEVVYERRKVFFPDRHIEEWLVKTDQNHIIDTLFQISNDDLERAVRNRTGDINLAAIERQAKLVAVIKSLPWWKRLLNRF